MKSSSLRQTYLPAYAPWLLSLVVTTLAVYVWGHSVRWELGQLSIYRIFPVLGLVGFSIMWSHYMTSLALHTVWRNYNYKTYFRLTSYVVLIAILLHPGLLIYKRFRDGFGLPPKSYESFVAPGLGWVTFLGSISLFIFLAYELHRWYSKRSWWKYVVSAGDVAMLAILYHGFRIGDQLQTGWYRYVWAFYAVTLIIALILTYTMHLRDPKRNDNSEF